MLAADYPAKGGIGRQNAPGMTPEQYKEWQGWTRNEKGELVVPPEEKMERTPAPGRRFNPDKIRQRQPRTEEATRGFGVEDIAGRPVNEQTIREGIEKAYVSLESLDSQDAQIKKELDWLSLRDKSSPEVKQKEEDVRLILLKNQLQREKIEKEIAYLNKMLTQETRPEEYATMRERQEEEASRQEERIKKDLIESPVWDQLEGLQGIEKDTEGKLLPIEQKIIMKMLKDSPSLLEDENRWEEFLTDLFVAVSDNRTNIASGQYPITHVSAIDPIYAAPSGPRRDWNTFAQDLKQRFNLSDDQIVNLLGSEKSPAGPSNVRQYLENRLTYDPVKKIDQKIREIENRGQELANTPEYSSYYERAQSAIQSLQQQREQILQAEQEWIAQNLQPGAENWTADAGEMRTFPQQKNPDNPSETVFDKAIEEAYRQSEPEKQNTKRQEFSQTGISEISKPIGQGLTLALQKLVQKYPEISADPSSILYRTQEGISAPQEEEREQQLEKVRRMRQRLDADDLVREYAVEQGETDSGQLLLPEFEEDDYLADEVDIDNPDISQAEYSQQLDVLEEEAAKRPNRRGPGGKVQIKDDFAKPRDVQKPATASYKDVVKGLVSIAEDQNDYSLFAQDENGNVLTTEDGQPALNAEGRKRARGIWLANIEDLITYLLYTDPKIQKRVYFATQKLGPKILEADPQKSIDGVINMIYTDVMNAIREKRDYSLLVRWPYIEKDAQERNIAIEEAVGRWLLAQVDGTVRRAYQGWGRSFLTPEFRKWINSKNRVFQAIRESFPQSDDPEENKKNYEYARQARSKWFQDNPQPSEKYTSISPLEFYLEQGGELDEDDLGVPGSPVGEQEITIGDVPQDRYQVVSDEIEQQYGTDSTETKLFDLLSEDPDSYFTVTDQTPEQATEWEKQFQKYKQSPSYNKAVERLMQEWENENPAPEQKKERDAWNLARSRYLKAAAFTALENWKDRNPKPNPARYKNISLRKGAWGRIVENWNEMYPDSRVNATAKLQKAWTNISKLFTFEPEQVQAEPEPERPREDVTSPVQPSEKAEQTDFANLLRRSNLLKVARLREMLKSVRRF
jgi:hypothetical protein